MELIEIINILQQEYPNKVIVDLSEYESEEHQTYKYLFEQLSQKYAEKLNEVGMLATDQQNYEKEIAELSQKNASLAAQMESVNQSTINSLGVIKEYVNLGIVVSDIMIRPVESNQTDLHPETFKKSISELPGIYEGKRPSWFSPLQYELSKQNVKKKNVNRTMPILKNKLLFWKTESGKNIDQIATDYEQNRKKNILELLESNCSNEEKYLKYFLLTPGLDKEFVKTLQGASELNLNANLIIALLEQPCDKFNREIIELYISEIHKGTEYNLKQELAEELVRGEWYITASINGVSKKMQLVPIDEIEEIKIRLEKISKCIGSWAADGEVCANLAQTSPDIFQNDLTLSDNVPESEDAPLIEFDDSMLEQY